MFSGLANHLQIDDSKSDGSSGEPDNGGAQIIEPIFRAGNTSANYCGHSSMLRTCRPADEVETV